MLKLEAESQALPDPVERDSATEGVVSPFGTNSPQRMIVSLEYRKKSGRTISEKCILNLLSSMVEPLRKESAGKSHASQAGIGLDFGTTFNLGLTQRQKESKEDVVLPHFSAQGLPPTDKTRGNIGEIEYTLDAEDDFDDEEDVDEDLLI
jgi:elongator complex protein 5